MNPMLLAFLVRVCQATLRSAVYDRHCVPEIAVSEGECFDNGVDVGVPGIDTGDQFVVLIAYKDIV